MPKIKSARKALRQNLKRKQANLIRKQTFKGVIKTYRELVRADKIEEAKKQLSQIYKSLDKSAKTNLLKRGKARRLKSRLAKKLNPKR